jgi:hypothetical protein
MFVCLSFFYLITTPTLCYGIISSNCVSFCVWFLSFSPCQWNLYWILIWTQNFIRKMFNEGFVSRCTLSAFIHPSAFELKSRNREMLPQFINYNSPSRSRCSPWPSVIWLMSSVGGITAKREHTKFLRWGMMMNQTSDFGWHFINFQRRARCFSRLLNQWIQQFPVLLNLKRITQTSEYISVTTEATGARSCKQGWKKGKTSVG